MLHLERRVWTPTYNIHLDNSWVIVPKSICVGNCLCTFSSQIQMTNSWLYQITSKYINILIKFLTGTCTVYISHSKVHVYANFNMTLLTSRLKLCRFIPGVMMEGRVTAVTLLLECTDTSQLVQQTLSLRHALNYICSHQGFGDPKYTCNPATWSFVCHVTMNLSGLTWGL